MSKTLVCSPRPSRNPNRDNTNHAKVGASPYQVGELFYFFSLNVNIYIEYGERQITWIYCTNFKLISSKLE